MEKITITNNTSCPLRAIIGEVLDLYEETNAQRGHIERVKHYTNKCGGERLLLITFMKANNACFIEIKDCDEH